MQPNDFDEIANERANPPQVTGPVPLTQTQTWTIIKGRVSLIYFDLNRQNQVQNMVWKGFTFTDVEFNARLTVAGVKSITNLGTPSPSWFGFQVLAWGLRDLVS